jgi:hypothetical protein
MALAPQPPGNRRVQRTAKEYAEFLAWLRWGVESVITPPAERPHVEAMAERVRQAMYLALDYEGVAIWE